MTSAAILHLENQMLIGPIVHTYPEAIEFVKKLTSINTQLASFPKNNRKNFCSSWWRNGGITWTNLGKTRQRIKAQIVFKAFK